MGSAFCPVCAKGPHSSHPTDGNCADCPLGYFQGKEEQQECVVCPSGYGTEKEGSTECVKPLIDLGLELFAPVDLELVYLDAHNVELTWKAAFVVVDNTVEAVDGYEVQIADNREFRLPGAKAVSPPAATTYVHQTNKTVLWHNPTPSYLQVRAIKGDNKSPWSAATEPWPRAADCSDASEYLDVSKYKVKVTGKKDCRPCPKGASCRGPVTWSGVTAKFGWSRVEHTPGEAPPICLDKAEDVKPACAFSPCIYRAACLGAPNEVLESQFGDRARASNGIESCDIARGYRKHCRNPSNASATTPCRLCATCAAGYKRHGSGARCKKCPEPGVNRLLLALGALVMFLGSAIMIYLAITSEASDVQASDAVKKILLNYLQLVSLAAGLPLQWPSSVETMLDSFSTLSSAGSTLLVPDCELTDVPGAEAFYMKQIAFTFIVPFVVCISISAWACIWLCGSLFRSRVNRRRTKNYAILSIVLMLFLSFPMLVRLTLSMLKCPVVGEHVYLMADLQEPCFEGRHLVHVLILTVPQFLLYVLGLPLLALVTIYRGVSLIGKEQDARASLALRRRAENFRLRFSLLYMGYRKERAWWEVVIAFRKIAVVAIGTFGALLGVVDLQAILSLLVVFLSIVTHLAGKPFDVSKPVLRMLHNLEFAALCVCWGTFWSGLLFFLGREKVGSVAESVFIFMSLLLVSTNMGYVLAAVLIFVRAYLRDRKKVKARRAAAAAVLPQLSEGALTVPLTAVVPVEDRYEQSNKFSLEPAAAAALHKRQHAATVDSIHEEHQVHEDKLKRDHSRRQEHARRQTQLRLIARLQVKQTKALHKVPAFSGLDQDSLARIVDAMSYRKVPAGTVLCREGEVADEFHVCVTGSCAVTVERCKEGSKTEGGFRVGTIDSLQFFGETAFGAEGNARRGATVTAESKTVQLLSLKRKQFARLVATGVVNRTVISEVHAVHQQREAANQRLQEEKRKQQHERRHQQHAGEKLQEKSEGGGFKVGDRLPAFSAASSSTAVAL